MSDEEQSTWSSGNIFKDLNVSNPNTELLRSDMIITCARTFGPTKATQAELMRKLEKMSLEEILEFTIVELGATIKFSIIKK